MLSHQVLPSFIASSHSQVTQHIQSSLALSTAFFPNLCCFLNSSLSAVELVWMNFQWALSLMSISGVRVSILSSNHSGCLHFLLPLDSSADSTMQDLRISQFSSDDLFEGQRLLLTSVIESLLETLLSFPSS